PGSGAVVRHYLTEFVANSGEINGVSTFFVVITAVLLLWQVDREINTTWGTREPRSFARRIFVYALALTAGPALIGATIYFINWLIQQSIAATPFGAEALSLLVQPVALLVDTAVFTLIYAFVPARTVPFRLALLGGLLAAIAFEAAKHGFRFYITQVPTYQVIYGALATLPLFLLWIYLSWVIVLVGAAITATLAERHGSCQREKPASGDEGSDRGSRPHRSPRPRAIPHDAGHDRRDGAVARPLRHGGRHDRDLRLADRRRLEPDPARSRHFGRAV